MRDFKLHFVTVFLAVAVVGSCGTRHETQPVTAILGAFDVEVELIKTAMTEKRDTTFMGITYTVGKLKGRRVALAEAGIGKVNAAVTTTLLIEHFRPGEIIFTGIAGGLNPVLQPGDIVIGARTAQHDYSLLTADGPHNVGTKNPISGDRNPVFFAADARLLRLAKEASTHAKLKRIPAVGGERTPRIVEGVIATGDAFIASDPKKKELRDRLGADAVEMEGAAVAQVCFQFGVPCLVVRSISDLADASAVNDVERFYRIAADNSASFVLVVVGLIAREELE
ncbi:MAG: 5'-methylthioadenosine/adenosylhomocysteine nucleosidase [Candidatus Latescibacterota bacterium]|nr:MAG: 5'-methylthioadenosine/adenosylhomocysteine nucleosidase [Candidatus Latescibacterota bacterium]